MKTETYDVVIAGGAVMGSSVAYHLRMAGIGRVLALDKDLTYRHAASALSLSSVRQQFSSPINIKVGLYGREFLRRAPDLLEVDGDKPALPFVENGYLYLATAAGAPVLSQNQALQNALGADIALLDPPALKARFPFIEVEGLAAASLGLSGEGWFDGYSLMQAFRRKARSLGVTYRGSAAVGLERDGPKVQAVRLVDGSTIACGAFVNVAGASGAVALAKALDFALPVHSRKRCVFVFSAKERIERCPLVIDPSGVYFRPEGENFVCGATPPDDPDCEDFEVQWEQFEEVIWPVLAHRVPAFESIRVGRAWAGHYDLNVFDHNALVGRLPGADNAYLAAGFSGHGIQQSPAIGRGLAELIASGGYQTMDLADFGVERIAEGRPLLERNVI